MSRDCATLSSRTHFSPFAQALHRFFCQWCSQYAPLPQSLYWSLSRLCSLCPVPQAEAVPGRHRGHRDQLRCPTSRTTARQRVLSHPLAPIASHRPTLLHGRPHLNSQPSQMVCISFPTRWSHGHTSARRRDRAHPSPVTSL